MKQLEQYLDKHFNMMFSILEKPSRSYTSETFHQLRIEIKKLRAVFRMIYSCSEKFRQKKLLRPFKLIFQQAGKIRDLQVEEDILKKYFSAAHLKNYKYRLEKLQLHERQIFFLTVSKSVLQSLKNISPEIISFGIKIKKADALKILNKKNEQINLMLHRRKLKTSEIHKLRKRLKEYNYLKSIFLKNSASTSISNNKELTNQLGKWHDYYLISEHLYHVSVLSDFNEQELKQLKTTIKKIKSECQDTLQKISIALQNAVRPEHLNFN